MGRRRERNCAGIAPATPTGSAHGASCCAVQPAKRLPSSIRPKSLAKGFQKNPWCPGKVDPSGMGWG